MLDNYKTKLYKSKARKVLVETNKNFYVDLPKQEHVLVMIEECIELGSDENAAKLVLEKYYENKRTSPTILDKNYFHVRKD